MIEDEFKAILNQEMIGYLGPIHMVEEEEEEEIQEDEDDEEIEEYTDELQIPVFHLFIYNIGR